VFLSAFLVVAAWAAMGCASAPSSGGDSSAIPSSSGVTVFGTVDAGVSHYKNR
jgi:hypothetical protein